MKHIIFFRFLLFYGADYYFKCSKCCSWWWRSTFFKLFCCGRYVVCLMHFMATPTNAFYNVLTGNILSNFGKSTFVVLHTFYGNISLLFITIAQFNSLKWNTMEERTITSKLIIIRRIIKNESLMGKMCECLVLIFKIWNWISYVLLRHFYSNNSFMENGGTISICHIHTGCIKVNNFLYTLILSPFWPLNFRIWKSLRLSLVALYFQEMNGTKWLFKYLYV